MMISLIDIKLSLAFSLPQNNPEIESFWSPLSFETSFVKFQCETKKCFRFLFFSSLLKFLLSWTILYFYFLITRSKTITKKVLLDIFKKRQLLNLAFLNFFGHFWFVSFGKFVYDAIHWRFFIANGCIKKLNSTEKPEERFLKALFCFIMEFHKTGFKWKRRSKGFNFWIVLR